MIARTSGFWMRAAAALAFGVPLSLGVITAVPTVAPAAASASASDGDHTSARPARHGPPKPLIVAHRAGTADYPENTIAGIRGSLRDGADGLWLTVQLSQDGIPVLYRPIDLAVNTDGTGTVAERTATELTGLNAGWNFSPRGSEAKPYRSAAARLPTLRHALAEVPAGMPLFLDLKQADPERLADAVVAVLRGTSRLDDTVIYSTDSAATGRARRIGDVAVAEDRDVTRERLLEIALTHQCGAPPPAGTWMAFEDRRRVTVSETFTSGTATTDMEITPWDRESIRCIDPQDRVNLMAIGVADGRRYQALARLGVDAVLVDSPRDASGWTSSPSR
ncbi:MAG: hypothetical protein K0Q52_3789 [Microbacterium sp.]|nr:hypothetical protein [Microbacterium sp.]